MNPKIYGELMMQRIAEINARHKMNESDRKAAQWHIKKQAEKDRYDYRRYIFYSFLFVGGIVATLIWYILK